MRSDHSEKGITVKLHPDIPEYYELDNFGLEFQESPPNKEKACTRTSLPGAILEVPN